ncbi:hypothetical protein [Alloprevotella tannerae]|uniref:hypothetical protein n=1 Tax=Alloprevotella tannerae TaxID=76122 RepID=UPI0028E77862|nr:hypothetical protein [Alloprevotella tannerae]
MHIDSFWLLSLWLLSFLVAIMLYLKWTAPILDRWNNLLRRSKSFVLLSATIFFIGLGMFYCKFYVYEQPSQETEIQNTNSLSSKASKPRVIFSEKGDFIYVLVVLFLAFLYFLIQYKRLKRWIGEHPDYAILVSDLQDKGYVKQKVRILNDGFLPISRGLAFRTFNEYLVVPGQHTFHFEVKESRFKGGDNVLFTQHMDLDLAPSSMYIIKREGMDGKLNYHFKCESSETNNSIL